MVGEIKESGAYFLKVGNDRIDRILSGQENIGASAFWYKEIMAVDVGNNNNGSGKKDSPDEMRIKKEVIQQIEPLSHRLNPERFRVLLEEVKKILWEQGKQRKQVRIETHEKIDRYRSEISHTFRNFANWQMEFKQISIGGEKFAPQSNSSEYQKYLETKKHIEIGLKKARLCLSDEDFFDLFSNIHKLLWEETTPWNKNLALVEKQLNPFQGAVDYLGKGKEKESEKIIERGNGEWIRGFSNAAGQIGDYVIRVKDFENLLYTQPASEINSVALASYCNLLRYQGRLNYTYLSSVLNPQAFQELGKIWSSTTTHSSGWKVWKSNDTLAEQAYKELSGRSLKEDLRSVIGESREDIGKQLTRASVDTIISSLLVDEKTKIFAEKFSVSDKKTLENILKSRNHLIIQLTNFLLKKGIKFTVKDVEDFLKKVSGSIASSEKKMKQDGSKEIQQLLDETFFEIPGKSEGSKRISLRELNQEQATYLLQRHNLKLSDSVNEVLRIKANGGKIDRARKDKKFIQILSHTLEHRDQKSYMQLTTREDVIETKMIIQAAMDCGDRKMAIQTVKHFVESHKQSDEAQEILSSIGLTKEETKEINTHISEYPKYQKENTERKSDDSTRFPVNKVVSIGKTGISVTRDENNIFILKKSGETIITKDHRELHEYINIEKFLEISGFSFLPLSIGKAMLDGVNHQLGIHGRKIDATDKKISPTDSLLLLKQIGKTFFSPEFGKKITELGDPKFDDIAKLFANPAEFRSWFNTKKEPARQTPEEWLKTKLFNTKQLWDPLSTQQAFDLIS